MAARENQGLQIALIIFVMLTIGGLVGTYFYFSRWQEQVTKNKQSTETAATATSEKDKATKEKADLLALIGGSTTDPIADIIDANKKKIDAYAAAAGYESLPADSHTYQKFVETLITTVKTANATRDSTQKTLDQTKKAADDASAKAAAKVAELEASVTTANNQLAEQTKKYNDAVIELNKTKDLLAKDKNDLNIALEKLKAEKQKEISGLGTRIAHLTSDLKKARQALDATNQPVTAVSGGTVLWVNQRDNVAYLSLGSADNLQRKTTFNVYPQGTANVTGAVPKGKVEVTNITGTHTSEARIVENPIGDPLLPGDVVHSGAWSPNQHLHYAIGGLVDLDGSGNDRSDKVREMIESTGGVVDAYIEGYKDSDGHSAARVKGAITINTRYLIVGDQESSSPAAVIRRTPTSTLITEASRLHVEQIGLNKFLAMSGYVAPLGVGPGAAGASNRGTIQGSPNNVFQNSFRPRQPGAGAANAGTAP